MRTDPHEPGAAVATLRPVDVLISQGRNSAETIQAIGVIEVTYCRCRKEFGGLKSNQSRRMRQMGVENQRLRKAIAT